MKKYINKITLTKIFCPWRPKYLLQSSRTVVLLIIICLILLNSTMCFASEELDDYVLQLRWEHQYQFAGYYAALWNGYYRSEGLNIEIRPGFGESGLVLQAPIEVSEGRADFGVGAVDILLAIDQGKELSIISSIFQRSAVSYFALEDIEFNSVYDFSRLNVARRRNDLLDIELQAMLLSEGLHPKEEAVLSEETILTVDDLINKKYDIIPEYLGKVSYQAKNTEYKVKVIKPIDYGIDFYGDSIFTSDELARTKPEVVEKFRRATIKGWEYALENPEIISARIVSEFYTESNNIDELFDYNIFQAEQIKELTLYPIVEIGNVNSFRWNKMTTFLKDLNIISGRVNIEEHIFDYRKIQDEKNAKKTYYYQSATIFLVLIIIVAYILYVTNKNTDLKNEITYRKRVEERTKLNNQRFQTLFDSFFLGITVTNDKGQILQVNDKWAEMTGFSVDELVEMNIFDIIDDVKANMENNQFKGLREGKVKSIDIERRYHRKNGKKFWGNLFMTSIIDPETKEQAFLGMVLDITQRKFEQESVKRAEDRFRKIINDVALEIEEEPLNSNVNPEVELYDSKSKMSFKLEKINIKLERMFKNELDENKKKEALLIYQARLAAMGEMVANIAHQWRQPLNNLGIILSNVEDAYKFDELTEEELSTSMGRAKNLIFRMSETIDDFRDFLKPKLQTEDFEVCKTIKSVLNMLQENFEFNHIKVNLDCQESLIINGSKNHYSQVIFNLLNNAIDSLSESDNTNNEISIIATETGDTLSLFIRDNGLGIPEESVENIFDPYFSTKDENKGTGLGLYMVKNIIEGQMNGKVSLTDYNNGAEFVIEVPKQGGSNG